MFKKVIMIYAFAIASVSFSAENWSVVSGTGFAPYVDDSLEGNGPVVILVKEIFKTMEEAYSLSYLPWARGAYETEKGLKDATFPYIPTQERKEKFHYSIAISQNKTAAFVSKGLKVGPKNLKSLKNKNICMPVGWETSASLASLSLNRVAADDMDSCFKMLKSKRVDIVTSPTATGLALVKKLFGNTSTFKYFQLDDKRGTLHLITPKTKKHKAMLRKFDKAYLRLVKSGKAKKILGNLFYNPN